MTWNEIGGCKLDVPKIDRSKFFEVFAIDGGSTDGTKEYLEENGIQVFRQRKPGLNAAYVDANFFAKGDSVVVFFPKGTTPVRDAVRVAEALANFDLVIASSISPIVCCTNFFKSNISMSNSMLPLVLFDRTKRSDTI